MAVHFRPIILPQEVANAYPTEEDVDKAFVKAVQRADVGVAAERQDTFQNLLQGRGWGCAVCIDAVADTFITGARDALHGCGHGSCLDCLEAVPQPKKCPQDRSLFGMGDVHKIVDNDKFNCKICNLPAYQKMIQGQDRGKPVLSTLCGRATFGAHPDIRVGHLFHERCFQESLEANPHECPACPSEEVAALPHARALLAGDSDDDDLFPGLGPMNADDILRRIQIRQAQIRQGQGVQPWAPAGGRNNGGDAGTIGTVSLLAGYAFILLGAVLESDVVTLMGFEAVFIGGALMLLDNELYGLAFAVASLAVLPIALIANIEWLAIGCLYAVGAGVGYEVGQWIPTIVQALLAELWR